MKKSLNHLPKKKQEELNRIASLIREMCDNLEMIILFGSYSRGDWKEEADLEPDRKSGHKSDYDILVVTKEKSTAIDTRLWNDTATKCNALNLSTHVRIIAHDIQDINIKLAEGQYFYTDVKKEGCLLYDSSNFKLARKRKLRLAEQQRIAQDYFDHWFTKAKHFYDDFAGNFERECYSQSAFMLHQATEASYKAILLVFTNYNPNEHFLGILGSTATKCDPAFQDIFPKETEEEEERFRLLDYAYIGARYDPDFRVTKEDLEYLSERVKILLELTEKICKEKIQSFTENTKLKG